jgi:hypothetical protein
MKDKELNQEKPAREGLQQTATTVYGRKHIKNSVALPLESRDPIAAAA